MKQHRIVCAAERFDVGSRSTPLLDPIVVCCIRHNDMLLNNVLFATKPMLNMQNIKSESGFVDNRGNFLTRTEAWKVAEAASQILYRVGGDETDGGTLYSENLY